MTERMPQILPTPVPRLLRYLLFPVTSGIVLALTLANFDNTVPMSIALLEGLGLVLLLWWVLTFAAKTLGQHPIPVAAKECARSFLWVVAGLLLWLPSASTDAAADLDYRARAMLFALGALCLIIFGAVSVSLWIRGEKANVSFAAIASHVKIESWLVLGLIFGSGLFYLSASAISRHEAWLTFTADLGVMDQTLWNTAHGRLLTHTVDAARPEFRPFSGRVELMYLPVALLYRLYSDARTALFAQALFVAGGVFPLFLIARKIWQSETAALVFAFAYILHPAIQGVCLHSIHGNTLSIPFLLLSLYGIEKRNARQFLAGSALALACREDVGFVLAPIALYAWWRWRDDSSLARRGLWVCAFCAVYIAFTLIILPMLSHTASGLASETVRQREMLGHLKAGMVGMVKTFARKPQLIPVELFTWENAFYLFVLLAPLGFYSLLAPALLLTITPALALHLISGWVLMKNYQSQYPATFLPVIFVAATMGGAWLAKRGHIETHHHRKETALLTLLAGAGLFCQRFFGAPVIVPHFWDSKHIAAMEFSLARVPRDASITVSQHLGPHASQRERFYGEESPGKAEFVIYDSHEPFLWERVTGKPEVFLMDPHGAQVFSDRGYGVVRCIDGVVTFRRGADYYQGLRRLFTLSASPPIGQKLTIENLQLVEARLQPRKAAHGGFVEVILTWRVQRTPKSIPLVRLWCQTGDSVNMWDHQVIFGHLPLHLWGEGSLIRDRFYIRFNQENPAGECRLYVDRAVPSHCGSRAGIPSTAHFIGTCLVRPDK